MRWRLALAVLLEAPLAAAPARKPRRWYPPERVAISAEPEHRLVHTALVTVARRARTRADDRSKTRAYAVKRHPWRLRHAQRSRRSACSLERLVDGPGP